MRLTPGGRIVIGDIAFATRADLDRARARFGDDRDESEHYWAADDAIERARSVGLAGEWERVSDCAGVLTFAPAE